MSALTLIAAATERPVSLAEAKLHLKLDAGDEDALVEALLEAATAACRAFTGRELTQQTWRLTLDRTPDGPLALPRPPLVSITSVIAYDDADQAATLAAANYLVDRDSVPGRIVLRRGASWPTIGRVANGLEVVFVAGHGAHARDVPAPLRQGILVLVAHGYERREPMAGDMPALPATVRALWQPYRTAGLAQ